MTPIRLADGFGQYAVVHREPRSTVLERDPLGLHKLFYAVRDGAVDTDTKLYRLRERGHLLNQIASAPPGRLRLSHEDRMQERTPPEPLRFGTKETELLRCVRDLRGAWSETLDAIADARGDRPLYVALSGGLDSTFVAWLARERFPDLRAITFRLDDGPVDEDEDLSMARSVASAFDLPHREVVCDEDEVFELLDEVLRHGQDYRDFNVHCGLVNAAMARSLEGEHAMVLTGDGANELFADYAPVRADGRQHYPVPRLPRRLLREVLVRGLDAGDREAGIFTRWGVASVRPFLLCARAYASLPPNVVEDPRGKHEVTRWLAGNAIPDRVYMRKAVRAQCAHESVRGVFAAAQRRGMMSEALLARFATVLDSSVEDCRSLIRAGMYDRACRSSARPRDAR